MAGGEVNAEVGVRNRNRKSEDKDNEIVKYRMAISVSLDVSS